MWNWLRCLIALVPVCGALAAPTWKLLEPGLAYAYISPHFISTSASSIYAFRIDPRQYQLRLVSAKQLNQSAVYAKDVIKKTNAILAINGGFFSPEKKALGLRIQNGKVLNPLRRISWWGVFYIQNNQPHVTTMQNFRYQPTVQFAVQAGPRLLQNGRKLKLKEGRDLRSALCVDAKQQIIIAVTNNLALTTNEFADFLLKFGCVDALNLDGGNSSQLVVKTPKFTLDIESYRPVADSVAVFKKP